MSISVIIPTRNRARLLKRSLDSVLAQNLRPAEIIIVDDASTDETSSLLGSYQLDNLQYIKLPDQGGACHARNVGVEASSNPYIAFLDDDDLWLPGKLQHQWDHISTQGDDVGMVCCGYRTWSDTSDCEVKTWIPPAEELNERYFMRTTGFMTSIPLISRTCFERVGLFDEGLAGSQDLDLWIRIADEFKISSIRHVLAEHHIHGNQITSNLSAKVSASEKFLAKYKKRLSIYPDLLIRHLKRAALLHCAAGYADEGQGYLKQALSLDDTLEDLRLHLEHSLADPDGHAQSVLDAGFIKVDGIPQYY